ncbi:MAG TPA: hypothetical protein DCP97_05705 [Ruminococcaceae bacterium]|nr:hypothetical protein [Oscillospiraceae bacterium]
MSFGLALAGGGTRGATHVGVLLALEENGLRPACLSGCSAGGIIAGLYAAGLNAFKLRNILVDLAKNGSKLIDADYFGIAASVIKLVMGKKITYSGYLKGNKLEKLMYEYTNGININEVYIPLVIPAVDLCSGKTIAFTSYKLEPKPLPNIEWQTGVCLAEVMRASAAVPGVFRPKYIGDYCLVDGGVTNILPVDLLSAFCNQKIIAIDISEQYNAPEHGNIFEITTHSYELMRLRLIDCLYQHHGFLIRPPLPENAGLLTFEYMVECMNIGYDTVSRIMPAIKEYLAE